MQVSIEQEQIKNDNLKNVKNFEGMLRKTRDQQETEMLNTAGVTQKNSIKWTQDCLNEVLQQTEEIKQDNANLKNKMKQRMNVNVQQLIKLIEEDMSSSQSQINDLNQQTKEADGQYQTFKHNNKQMQSQNQKLEQTFKEIMD